MRWIDLYLGLRSIYRKVKRDPSRHDYMDMALTPVTDDEVETMELFKSDVAQAFVTKIRRVEKIRHGEAA